MLRSIPIWLFVIAIPLSGHATRYHVNAAATGNNTGLSWTNAFTDLQEALGVVIPGDEIWVSAGQYRPTMGTSRTISFQIRNGVNMYGGFAGTESALEERDIAAHPTVLNGDIGEPGTSSDNSYTVVTASQLTIPTVLDGFRIMNGNAGGSYNGGGMRVTNTLAGRLTVRNCTLVNNYASTYGGGIYLGAAKITLENCDLINNSAGTGGDGGAILNGNNNGGPTSVLIIRDCRFTNNTARRGACLFNNIGYDTLLVERSVFTNNTSEFSILSIDDFNEANMLDSYIIGNTVNGSSNNVLYVNASAPGDQFSMINCTVAHNFNLHTGSLQDEIIKFLDTQHVIQNSILFGNSAYSGRQVSTNVVITSSIVQGGHSNGSGIVDLDPQFNAPYSGTPTNFDATVHDYRPVSTSPAINSGNNDLVPTGSVLDLAGNPRIQGGTVDMGCYESDISTAMPTSNARPMTWSFDPGSRTIRIPEMEGIPNGMVMFHDADGREVQRTRISGNVVQVPLPSGVYIASHPRLGRLKFVVP